MDTFGAHVCFLEKSIWCSIEKVCQGVTSPLSKPDERILRCVT